MERLPNLTSERWKARGYQRPGRDSSMRIDRIRTHHVLEIIPVLPECRVKKSRTLVTFPLFPSQLYHPVAAVVTVRSCVVIVLFTSRAAFGSKADLRSSSCLRWIEKHSAVIQHAGHAAVEHGEVIEQLRRDFVMEQ